MNTCQIFISKCGMDHKMLPKYAEEGCYSHVKTWLPYNCDEENSSSLFIDEESFLIYCNEEKYASPLYNTMVSCLEKGWVGF